MSARRLFFRTATMTYATDVAAVFAAALDRKP